MVDQLGELYRCGEELLALLGGDMGDAELDRLEALLSERELLTNRLSDVGDRPDLPSLESLLQQQRQLEVALRRHLTAHQAQMGATAERRSQVREFQRFIAPGGRSSVLDQRR